MCGHNPKLAPEKGHGLCFGSLMQRADHRPVLSGRELVIGPIRIRSSIVSSEDNSKVNDRPKSKHELTETTRLFSSYNFHNYSVRQ